MLYHMNSANFFSFLIIIRICFCLENFSFSDDAQTNIKKYSKSSLLTDKISSRSALGKFFHYTFNQQPSLRFFYFTTSSAAILKLFLNKWNFSRAIFLYFSSCKSSLMNFFFVKATKFHFQKRKKSFHSEKI